MKKFTAAFDGLKYAQSTADYACAITSAEACRLTGVFLESFLYHSFYINDMVGERGISETKLRNLLKKDKATRAKSADDFAFQCAAANLSYQIRHDAGFSLRDILTESVYSDLLITGAGETMNHFSEPIPTLFVRHLVAEIQCPVLVVPKLYTPINEVILLYDGNPASVYAMRCFAQVMPKFAELPVTILHIAKDKKSKFPEELLLQEFIESHFPNAEYSILQGNPEDMVIHQLRAASSGTLVVLGAYNRGAVSRFFKPSLADRLLEETKLPLFIAHHQ